MTVELCDSERVVTGEVVAVPRADVGGDGDAISARLDPLRSLFDPAAVARTGGGQNSNVAIGRKSAGPLEHAGW